LQYREGIMEKIVKIIVLSVCIFLFLNFFFGVQAKKTPESIARGKAHFFLNVISNRMWKNIGYIQFSYDLYLKKLFFNLELKAAVEIEKCSEVYNATFKIIDMRGVNIQDKLILPFLKMASSDLRDILKIELIEEMRIKDCKFVTNKLEQKTAEESIEINFRNNQIKLSWEEEEEKKFITIPMKDRVGPLATLFNYIFFYKEGDVLSLVAGVKNDEWLVLNQLSNIQEVDDPNINSLRGERIPEKYEIDIEVVELKQTKIRKYPGFSWVALFRGEKGREKDFLGLAKPFFFNFVQKHSEISTLRLPYIVIISGIVDTKKKISKLINLQRMYPNRKISENKLGVEDFIMAKDVIVYFTGYNFQKK